jgi:hypothetical protein
MATKKPTGNTKATNDMLRSVKSGFTMTSSAGKTTKITPKKPATKKATGK